MPEASDSPQFPLPAPLHPWLTKAEREDLDRPALRELRKARKLAAYPDTKGRGPRAIQIEKAVVAVFGASYRGMIREVVDAVLELIEDEGASDG